MPLNRSGTVGKRIHLAATTYFAVVTGFGVCSKHGSTGTVPAPPHAPRTMNLPAHDNRIGRGIPVVVTRLPSASARHGLACLAASP
jgi:hypothetical protein